MSKNTICHIEIAATDTKNTGEFYRDLFGWKLNYDMGEDYVMFQPEAGPGGGIMKTEKVVPSTNPVNYIEVDDIDMYLKRAEELGGGKAVTKTEIPNIGWYGQATDLDGNLIGLFTPKIK